MNNCIFASFIKKANIALNRANLTQTNKKSSFFLAFYRILYNINIKFLLNFIGLKFVKKKISFLVLIL